MSMAREINRVVAPFKVEAPYEPAGDQPQAIEELAERIQGGEKDVVLLGATGTGKSATTAWLVERLQRPTLVLVQNKTLAAQLANEFRELLPNNAVEYFVSYYDYYQPEAYVPQTDTFIEKDSSINEEVERLRHSATNALLTRRDTLVVATVSSIFGLGTPEEYIAQMVTVRVGDMLDRDDLLRQFVQMQYARNDADFHRGTFRVRGDTVEIIPMYEELAVRIEFFGDEIETIQTLHPLTGDVIREEDENPITFMFPLLMVVSTLGMMAGGASAAADVGPARRDYQRHLASVRRAVADAVGMQRASLVHVHPDPADAWTLAGTWRMWERSPEDGDFGAVRIGTGPHAPATPVTPPTVTAPEKLDPVSAVALRHVVRSARSVPDLPVAVDVGAFPLIAVGGDEEDAVALVRAMVAQLAAAHHPEDLAIAVVGVGPEWEWVKWLPHNAHPHRADASGPARLRASTVPGVVELLADVEAPLVVVVADGRDLDREPAQLEGLLGAGTTGESAMCVIAAPVPGPAIAASPTMDMSVASGLALTVVDGRVRVDQERIS